MAWTIANHIERGTTETLPHVVWCLWASSLAVIWSTTSQTPGLRTASSLLRATISSWPYSSGWRLSVPISSAGPYTDCKTAAIHLRSLNAHFIVGERFPLRSKPLNELYRLLPTVDVSLLVKYWIRQRPVAAEAAS